MHMIYELMHDAKQGCGCGVSASVILQWGWLAKLCQNDLEW